jgi:hypothetical protein
MLFRFTRSAGLFFMLAGILCWLGWALLPDLGHHDPAQTLALVAAHRSQVWWAVVTQLTTSLILGIGVIALQTDQRATRSKTMRVGATLVVVGAMGLCLEAFFHWLTFYMTAPTVVLNPMYELLRLLQTQGKLVWQVLELALLIGGTVYSAGLYHIDATSPWAKRVFLIGLAWGLIGSIVTTRLGIHPQWVIYGFFSWIALGYSWMGFEILFLMRPERKVAG